MRHLSLAVFLVLSGCTLDLEFLYGDVGDGRLDASMDAGPGMDAPFDAAGMDSPGMDVPREDAPGLDAPVDGSGDAGDAGTDAPIRTDVGDVGPSTLSLRVVGSFTFTRGAPTAVAAATGGGRATVAATASASGVLEVLEASGPHCVASLSSVASFASGLPGPVAVGQVDTDTLPDVVVGTAMGELATLRGNDLATLVRSPHGLGSLVAISLGIFPGDSSPDAFAVQAGPRAYVMRGNEMGGFVGTLGPSGSGNNFRDGAFFDLDDNGRLDIIALSRADSGTPTQLAWQSGSMLGSLTPQPPTTVGPSSERLATGRVDGDNRVFITGGDTLYVVSATGLTGTHPLGAGTFAHDVVLAELDGVAPRELVVTDPLGGVLRIFRWTRVGGLVPVDVFVTGGSPTELAAFDFDGDARDELVVLIDSTVRLIAAGCP